MNKILEKKKNIVEKIHNLCLNSILIALVEYKNINSLDLKFLRKELFENKIDIKVIRNNLAKKAFKNTHHSILIENIKEQVFLVFSSTEISLPIFILKKFNKINKNFKIKHVSIWKKLFFEKHLDKLINLPDRKKAIENLFIAFNLPINIFLETLKLPHINLINLIKLKNNTN